MFIEFHAYGGDPFIIPEDGIKGLSTEEHGVTKLKVFDGETMDITELFPPELD